MVHIITDSTCDLGLEKAQELGVEILPLTVCFGEETYLDYVELAPAEFFAKLRQAKTLPTTSQLNPDILAKSFQAAVDNGDDIVGIFISSELSGTYQSACIAREMISNPERVYLVDSRTATFVQGILVIEAARRRDAGDSAAAIQAYVQEKIRVRLRVRSLASVTLRVSHGPVNGKILILNYLQKFYEALMVIGSALFVDFKCSRVYGVKGVHTDAALEAACSLLS